MSAPAVALRVLLVDDDPRLRSVVRALLEREPGIAVVGVASTAEEAVAAAERARPDVVVMDLLVADATGVEAAREILAARSGPGDGVTPDARRTGRRLGSIRRARERRPPARGVGAARRSGA